jgi:prostaglandin-endoperoxide synthase 2
MSVIDSLLKFAGQHQVLHGSLRALNRTVINHFANGTAARPRAFSMWSPLPGAPPATTSDPSAQDYITDYTSWPVLVDKRWSGRHLPPAAPSYVNGLPDIGSDPKGNPADATGVTALFARPGAMTPSRSSLLFAFFAQWFTDSILRFDPYDRRKNTSNHDIDLCSIYGLTEATCRVLRTGCGGLLKSQQVNGEEYLEYLCERKPGFPIRAEFADLPIANRTVSLILDGFTGLTPPREEYLYATGLERGNSSIGYVAISTIFMREHNRIARELASQNPSWNDERIFQTARIINIVILM